MLPVLCMCLFFLLLSNKGHHDGCHVLVAMSSCHNRDVMMYVFYPWTMNKQYKYILHLCNDFFHNSIVMLIPAN